MINRKQEDYWDEEWKNINSDDIESDEQYQISNYGRVRHWKSKYKVWKILRNGNTKRDGTGYEYFTNFFKAGSNRKKRVSKLIHRLVGEAFCKQPGPRHAFVLHIDFDRSNNYYKNLKWVTRQEQVEHNRSNPRVKAAYAKQLGKIRNSKLTEKDVLNLKKDVAEGELALGKIAEKYNITHTQLNRIRKGENWAHVKYEPQEN